MKMLCLTSRFNRPSTRYRILQHLPYINSVGIETETAIIPREIKALDLLHSANKYDGVFIQKKLLSRVEQWYLRKRAKKIIYDFDDAVMYTKLKYSESTRRYKRFKCMMENADLVIAGNKYLAEIAKREHAKNVVVVPTIIDVAKYPLHTANNSNVTIGWIGTKSTQGYLKIVRPLFDELAKKYPKLRIKIVSDERPVVCGDDIIWEKWGQDKEIEQLLSFDIGIMPLRDDPWTKGKCGFKIIQYMAAGLPVVCSPVGVNTEIVRHGINGFHAGNIEEWETCILKLIEDADLYKRISLAGRETVEKNYNLVYWGPRLAEIIKEKLC